ncbi:MAG: C39 family peptidase [Rhodospirillales bacterium]|jgi:predicted double-glycine peptidase|nr:C39 family peptidase [Rhodospirillales bacterium]
MCNNPSCRRRPLIFLLAGTALLASATVGAARAGSIFLSGISLGAGTASVHVESLQARKFTRVIRQHYDFSCGSAALATLLTYNYGLPVSEARVFKSMFERGDKKVIARYGFSLLDMKNYLARHRLPSAGFRAPLARLAQVGVPAIALVDVRGYHHFVIIEGVRDRTVLLADPALGVRTEKIADFEKHWSGVFFLILTDVARAKGSFDNKEQWAVAPRVPFGLARYSVDLATLQQPALLNAFRF